MILFYPILFTGLLVCLISFPSFGENVNCKAEVSDYDFGNIVTGQSVSKQSVAGHVKFSCINRDSVPQYVSLCLNGPLPPSGSRAGNLSQEKGYSILFRNRTTGLPWGIENAPIRVTRVINANTEINETIPVSAEMVIDPLSATVGMLDTIFTLQSPSFSWYASPVPFGDNCPAYRDEHPISFSVRANVPKRCDVSADSLDFGRIVDFSGAEVLSQSKINIKCTNETNYSIALRSLNAGSTPFMMKNSANNKLTYTLYKDAARNDVWASGANMKYDRGTGKWQQHPVYGQVNVSSSATPASGDYTDTVVISLSY
ncbi:Csu type fimbrial protein [Enterobacter asburiae]|nr:spore coat protein U domain-containing protein [Enterobacter asburiae]